MTRFVFELRDTQLHDKESNQRQRKVRGKEQWIVTRNQKRIDITNIKKTRAIAEKRRSKDDQNRLENQALALYRLIESPFLQSLVECDIPKNQLVEDF